MKKINTLVFAGGVIHDWKGCSQEIVKSLSKTDDFEITVVEDDLDALVAQWRFTQDIEKLNVENNDISDFAFTLAHLCRTARNETDLGVFLLSDA